MNFISVENLSYHYESNDENDLTTRLYNKMLAINNVEEAAIQ